MEKWMIDNPRAKDPLRWALVVLTVIGNVYGGYAAGAAMLSVGGLTGVVAAIVGLYGTITLMELARHRIMGIPPGITSWGWIDDKSVN